MEVVLIKQPVLRKMKFPLPPLLCSKKVGIQSILKTQPSKQQVGTESKELI